MAHLVQGTLSGIRFFIRLKFSRLLFCLLIAQTILHAQVSDFQVNDVQGAASSSWGDYPEVSITIIEKGEFIITWTDMRDDYFDIYAQRFSNVGLTLGENFKVNSVSPGSNHWGPFVASDCNGDFVIVWNEILSQDTSHIYAQRFSSDGSEKGENFKISPWGTWAYVDLWNERIYNVWINFSDSTDYDIWANVMDWNDPFGITDEVINSSIQAISVYPNPSLGVIHLRYSISDINVIPSGAEGRYSIFEVFSIQGIKVRTLMDQVQPPGEYELSFDISDLPDGMYFVRMQMGGQVETAKIILIK